MTNREPMSIEQEVIAATFWAEWDSEREGDDVVRASDALRIAHAAVEAEREAQQRASEQAGREIKERDESLWDEIKRLRALLAEVHIDHGYVHLPLLAACVPEDWGGRRDAALGGVEDGDECVKCEGCAVAVPHDAAHDRGWHYDEDACWICPECMKALSERTDLGV